MKMCIENTLIDLSVESKGLSKAERLSLKLIAKEVKKLKAKNEKLEEKNKVLKDVVRLYRQDEPSAEEENLKNTKPCPYNREVNCVQYPEDSCGCDFCEECETKLKAAEELARRFHETYERLAPDFGYKTREASAKPWKDVPENNKQLMIAVCKEILQALQESEEEE